MSDDQLFSWVNESTLTFIGTIIEMNKSNVSGFEKDFPMLVRVEKIESGDPQGLKKFGDLKDSEVTLAVNPASRIGLRKNVTAVFFANPLVYETHIGMTANATPMGDQGPKEDFFKRLQAAAARKSEEPLRKEIASAELIVTGEVEAVRPLTSKKAVDFRSIQNSWELRSEHRPRWMEAIVKVQTVLKPAIDKQKEPSFVIVVFPRAHDCFWIKSPKLEANKSGIWLLHRDQLDQQESRVLLQSEKNERGEIQSYTALNPVDFQDLSTLARLQRLVTEINR